MKTNNKTFYVTMTDKHMSNWGKAIDLINKLIFICDDYYEAKIVYDNAKNREDMRYVNICSTKPWYYRVSNNDEDYVIRNYYVQIKTKNIYPDWYVKNSFNKG